MALKGLMKIEGVDKVYTVVECQYSMGQKVNPNNGLPQYGLSASQIVVTIISPDKGRPLYEWMMDEFHYLNGMIRLTLNVNSKQDEASRAIWFENAKCVGLYEYFNNQNNVMMITRLTLQPAKMGFVDGYNLEATNIGYDFRKQRQTLEKPARDIQDQLTNKFDFKTWQGRDRDNDITDQINNDPYYDQLGKK